LFYDYDLKPDYRSGRAEPEPSLAITYMRTASRWWVLIGGCAIAGAILSFSLTLSVMPVYQSRTSLDIQSLNGDFLNIRNTAPTGDQSASSGESYVQTQTKLLQSTTVLDRTVKRLKAEPHPDAVDRGDMISSIKRSLHLSHGGDLPYSELVDEAAKRVKVKPLGITRLVEVTCDSWDPKFSAKFCSTLTEEFKNIDLETRSLEAQKTSEFLTKQLADVRQKAEDSQKNLEVATGGDGFALSPESNAIGTDRLRQLQGELVHAQADRMEKQSLMQVALTSPADSIPATLDSPIYRDYQQKLADLNAKVAELVPPLTEENPKVLHLRAEIRDVQSGMEHARLATVERLRNDFESARHHEDLLNASYAMLQSSVSGEMSKTERVNLLRREVDSERQLYETLSQRAKEAGFVSAMQTTTIRVVDVPAAPSSPISPRRTTAASVGLLLGSLCGFGFAVFRDRTANVFRVPGETERLLRVHELGVIPNADRGLKPRVIAGVSLPSQISGSASKRALQAGNPPALQCWNQNFSIVAEAYRNTTHSILLAGVMPRASRVYVITSPNSGEGKTTVTVNLGVALSKSKQRVVVVDGDLRKPGLHKNFLVENGVGMRNVLREEIDVATAPLALFCKATVVPNLHLITSGTGNEEVVELLHSGAANGLFTRLSKEFDVVLIDTPPMLHMADARILAANSNGVILVFRAGVTAHGQAADAVDLFENDQIPLIGSILNDFDPAKEGQRNYYQSYYRYSDAAELDSSKAGAAV
jgi:capsular exopolysaccharide synthesis family protein